MSKYNILDLIIFLRDWLCFKCCNLNNLSHSWEFQIFWALKPKSVIQGAPQWVWCRDQGIKNSYLSPKRISRKFQIKNDREQKLREKWYLNNSYRCSKDSLLPFEWPLHQIWQHDYIIIYLCQELCMLARLYRICDGFLLRKCWLETEHNSK